MNKLTDEELAVLIEKVKVDLGIDARDEAKMITVSVLKLRVMQAGYEARIERQKASITRLLEQIEFHKGRANEAARLSADARDATIGLRQRADIADSTLGGVVDDRDQLVSREVMLAYNIKQLTEIPEMEHEDPLDYTRRVLEKVVSDRQSAIDSAKRAMNRLDQLTESVDEQFGRLSVWIIDQYPQEPREHEGVVGTTLRLLNRLQDEAAKARRLEAAVGNINNDPDPPWVAEALVDRSTPQVTLPGGGPGDTEVLPFDGFEMPRGEQRPGRF